MAAPNIVNVTAIYGKTAGQVVPATATAIVTNASNSGKVLKLNALYIGNTDTAIGYDFTAELYRGTTPYRFVANVTVPPKATLDVLSKSIYLEEGDSLRLTASTAAKLEAICSYEELN